MIYTPAYANRWQNEKFRALSPLGKLLFEYLTSNPATTSSGMYPLDLGVASADTSIPRDLLLVVLEELCTIHATLRGRRSPLVQYDGATVWIVGQWKHAVNHSANHKNLVGLEFNRGHRFPFWSRFFELYPDVLEHCTAGKTGKSTFGGVKTFRTLWSQLKDQKAAKLKPFSSEINLDPEALREALQNMLPSRLSEALRKPFDSKSVEGLQQRREEREVYTTPPLPSLPPRVSNNSQGDDELDLPLFDPSEPRDPAVDIGGIKVPMREVPENMPLSYTAVDKHAGPSVNQDDPPLEGTSGQAPPIAGVRVVVTEAVAPGTATIASPREPEKIGVVGNENQAVEWERVDLVNVDTGEITEKKPSFILPNADVVLRQFLTENREPGLEELRAFQRSVTQAKFDDEITKDQFEELMKGITVHHERLEKEAKP